ncbi:MAG: AAA family ATPase, partial [Nitrospira sp.]
MINQGPMSKNPSVRIKSFDVSGYRSCVHTRVDLNLELSALIGINGSGKTNVLQSLLLLKKLGNVRSFGHGREDKQSSVCEMQVVFRVREAKVSYSAKINYVTNELNVDEIVGADENWDITLSDGRVERSELPLSVLRLPPEKSYWMLAEYISRRERQKTSSLSGEEITALISRDTVDPPFRPILDEVASFV